MYPLHIELAGFGQQKLPRYFVDAGIVVEGGVGRQFGQVLVERRR